jgi:GDSL-like Lipase/Acylhydrolase family
VTATRPVSGIARHEAFPAQLEGMLRTAGYDVQVWNAGVTGDTFERMFARLDRYVPGGMKIVVLQGGYNDLLRRSNPAWTAGYLQAIVSRLRARQIKVVLCGFFYPDWDAVRIALAEYYGAVFVDGGSCYDRRYRGLDGLHDGCWAPGCGRSSVRCYPKASCPRRGKDKSGPG